jgi:hypothetical protein
MAGIRRVLSTSHRWKYIGPMPKVTFSRDFFPAGHGTFVPGSIGTFVRRASHSACWETGIRQQYAVWSRPRRFVRADDSRDGVGWMRRRFRRGGMDLRRVSGTVPAGQEISEYLD